MDKTGSIRGLRIFLIIVVIFSLTTWGTTPASQNPPRLWPVEAIRTDLDFLWQTIQKVHPRIDHAGSKEILEAEYRKIHGAISEAMDTDHIYLLFAPLMSLLQDGHSSLVFTMQIDKQPLFPFDLLFSREKVYLKRGYTVQAAAIAGSRLMAINGHEIDEVSTAMKSILPGETVSMKNHSLETDMFKIYYRLLFPEAPSFYVRIITPAEEEKTVECGSIRRAEIQEARKPANAAEAGSPQLRLDRERSLAVFTLKKFDEKDFKGFLRDSFKRINEAGIAHLLIDLRDNLGGDSEMVEELIDYLSEHPSPLIPRMGIRVSEAFKNQVKKRIPGVFRWLPLQYLDSRGRRLWQAEEGTIIYVDDPAPEKAKPAADRFLGQIALLINGHTYSAASLLAQRLKIQDGVKVYGLESGFTADGLFFEPLVFQLPSCRMEFRVSSMMIVGQDNSIHDGLRGVIPDFPLELDIAAEAAGRDSLLEQTLQMFLKSN